MDYDRNNRNGGGIINPATGRPYGTLENDTSESGDPRQNGWTAGNPSEQGKQSHSDTEKTWGGAGSGVSGNSQAQAPSYGDWSRQGSSRNDNGGWNGNGNGGGGCGNGAAPRQPKPVHYVSRTFLVVALIITMAVSTVLGGLFGFWLYDRASSSSYSNLSNVSLESAAGSEKTIEEIVSENEDSVVEITTESQEMSMFGVQTSEGAGSGVIVSEDGYIATNYHVIEGSSKVTVKLHSGESYDAEVVGYDSNNDIAVLKIDGKDLTAATIGKSSSVNVGDLAVAIGNPLGTLGGTATSGIISSLDRELTIDGRKLSLLQTDSAINPGNSGGGLFDGSGKLIGIVVAKGSGTGIEGLGFAIPIDTAAPIINQIIEDAE
ncbi:S1C family serine protease [Mobilibacterium timonense]|uniref:S1C family serine protease n=1 Tax=Mobilibacterium timonense TaxID=1871012 RepID=UPI001F3230E1|nr:trypsin-like peptidase domain-containing protein [Mobilibacterium timonense]